jgi:hypothetical protein
MAAGLYTGCSSRPGQEEFCAARIDFVEAISNGSLSPDEQLAQADAAIGTMKEAKDNVDSDTAADVFIRAADEWRGAAANGDSLSDALNALQEANIFVIRMCNGLEG